MRMADHVQRGWLSHAWELFKKRPAPPLARVCDPVRIAHTLAHWAAAADNCVRVCVGLAQSRTQSPRARSLPG